MEIEHMYNVNAWIKGDNLFSDRIGLRELIVSEFVC
jgi:hypothetical protein